MKQAKNNEVDLLLRSLARGRAESAMHRSSKSEDGNRAASDHLDADELNSYAEGAVPVPARARYMEHLADCDRCRGIVVGLTQAADAASRYEVSGQQERVGFWQKLRSLLSPAVLGYAVPALVLAAVIGIGFLAIRQQRQQELVALNRPQVPSTSSGQLKQAEVPTDQSSSDASSTSQTGSASPGVIDSVNEKRNLQEDKTHVVQGAGTGSGEVAQNAPLAKDAGQPAETNTMSELRPGYAPEPTAGARPPAAATRSEADKSGQFAKEQPAKLEDQTRDREEYKPTPSDEHGPNRGISPATARAQASNRRLDGLSAGRGGPSGQEKKDKAGEVETRTVSGRQFARDGNTWVDTAYDPSRTPVRVARGSEQFRALVADEPGLRTIAEQLNGVIIVVWKNRAYRIQ
jgi:hypothetical protein